jgi:hypothetical protein
MVTPFQGGDTSDTSFVRSQQVSNQCHDTSDTSSNKSRNGENSVELATTGKDVQAMLAAEQARLKAKEKKDGEGS